MAIDIQVKESYRGPMDLLLYLIKRDEVDIHDIPISHITKEYMKAIDEMSSVDVDVGSEFLELASILMEIKGRMLLPPEETEEDEEAIDIDPRSDLVKALLEYKKFKEAAGELDEMFDLHARRLPRVPSENIVEEVEESDMIDSNVYELYAAFARLMRETIASASATTIVASEISTEECINNIEYKLEISGRVTFKELFQDAPTRPAMVAYFIAILELVRLRKVHAMQSEDFGEIYLEKAQPDDFKVIAQSDSNPLSESNTLGEYVRKIANIINFPGIKTRRILLKNTVKPFMPVKIMQKTIKPKQGIFDQLFKIKNRQVKSKKIKTKPIKQEKKKTQIFPEACSFVMYTDNGCKSNILSLPASAKEKTHAKTTEIKTGIIENKTDANIGKIFKITSIKLFLELLKTDSKKRRKSSESINIFDIFRNFKKITGDDKKQRPKSIFNFPAHISLLKTAVTEIKKDIVNLLQSENTNATTTVTAADNNADQNSCVLKYTISDNLFKNNSRHRGNKSICKNNTEKCFLARHINRKNKSTTKRHKNKVFL